jgi:hypothetical protein
MIFCTQIRRRTESGRLAPVVVSVDDIVSQFSTPPTIGSPCSVFQLRMKVQADTDQDGTPDVGSEPWSYWEMEKVFYANETQRGIVDARLRNGGNLMAGIRVFFKARVRAHNEAMAPSGEQETYIDIDTDA